MNDDEYDPGRAAILRHLAAATQVLVAAKLAYDDALAQLNQYDSDRLTDSLDDVRSRALALRSARLDRLHVSRMPPGVHQIDAPAFDACQSTDSRSTRARESATILGGDDA